MKQSLPDDIDSGNETDSESRENVPVVFSVELIVACLDDSDCNNLTKIRARGSLTKLLLLIILYVLRVYLDLSILVPCTCLYPSWKWHACI